MMTLLFFLMGQLAPSPNQIVSAVGWFVQNEDTVITEKLITKYTQEGEPIPMLIPDTFYIPHIVVRYKGREFRVIISQEKEAK